MNKWVKRTLIVLPLVIVLGLSGYGAKGWLDARADAPALRERAKQLEAQGVGASALGPEKRKLLLLVEDPSFDSNNGVDLSTAGAGTTTITQSLSKKLAFTHFRPGLRKIRQTGYAMGLSGALRKEEVLTLFLDKAGFRGRDRKWTDGFDAAAQRFFGKRLADIDLAQFTQLVATGVAPRDLNPDAPNAKLQERIKRIDRLAAGDCKPIDNGDVWLEGCASTSP